MSMRTFRSEDFVFDRVTTAHFGGSITSQNAVTFLKIKVAPRARFGSLTALFGLAAPESGASSKKENGLNCPGFMGTQAATTTSKSNPVFRGMACRQR